MYVFRTLKQAVMTLAIRSSPSQNSLSETFNCKVDICIWRVSFIYVNVEYINLAPFRVLISKGLIIHSI